MKVEERDGTRERLVLTGMVTDEKVLSRVASRWDGENFAADWLNVVGGWCVNYYRKHNEAPRGHVRGLFASWAERRKDDGLTRAVADFLTSLSDDYEREESGNPDYLVDQASELFRTVKLARLRDEISGCLDAGRLDDGEQVALSFTKMQMGQGSRINVFNDEAEIRETFAHDDVADLVTFHGALGEFFKGQLVPDSLIGFNGPEKSGKCISEDMEVLLADGRVRTIRRIVEDGDKTPVVALDEETQRFVPMPTAELWDNGVKECWAVKTKSGRRVVTTPNHKYLTPDGWKELGDLRVGEFIAVPKRLPFFGDKRMPEAEVKYLAYMLAEGCCTSTQPSFTNTDPEMVDDFASCCDALGFGHRRKGISTFVLGSGDLRRKYPEALLRVTSKTKVIPDCIFSCPRDQVALFLRVFFSCDGHISRDSKHIEMSLANRRMLRQIGHLLTRFGIVYKFDHKPVNLNGKRFWSWRITISSAEYVSLFLREINFLSYKKRDPQPAAKLKSFLDRFPWQVAQRFYEEMRSEYPELEIVSGPTTGGKRPRKNGPFYKVFGRWKAAALRGQVVKKLPVMRQSFATGDPDGVAFRKYMGSDVLWDEVVEIQNVGKKRTYDLSVPVHHNFVANDAIVHNTWWVMELGYQALRNRKRVAFFEVGDMSTRQIKKRLLCRASRHPTRSTNRDGSWPCSVRKPVKLARSPDGKPPYHVEFGEEVVFDAPLSADLALARSRKLLKTDVRAKDSYFCLSVHPCASISVLGIKDQLKQWADEDGWVPQVVVIDYADILAPIDPKKDVWYAIDQTWGKLRALSQELHCCVVTATQADAASYDVETQSRKNFGHCKAKLAHATAFAGINVTGPEKELGLCRLNWLVAREGPFSNRTCVHVAGCLPLANVAVCSLW